MPTSHPLNFSEFTPEAVKLSDIRGSEMLPFALYNLAALSMTDIQSLLTILDKNNIIGTEPSTAIHLVGGESS